MIRQITRNELEELIHSRKKFVLVDVLPADSYFREHIKGAISLPLEDIEQKAAGALRKDAQIVTYCASFECQASTKAAEKLIALGYSDVVDYKGGLKDYKEAKLPLEGSLYQATAKAGSCCCSCQ
ncbi:MAG TPA: rhodanese-like domain-containing protein [Patescibacteria group bacterium]|nr:rhodanese-like domain-containing protein [Patescibacteria group bacterium]